MKQRLMIDEEENVKQNLTLINWEDGKKEETLYLVTENVCKARTKVPEVVNDTGCTSDSAGRKESCWGVHDRNESKNWKKFPKRFHENF